MSYIKYNDDPLARRVSDAFANLCAGDPTKKVLKLLDRCFSIFNGSKKEASFCEIENFIYPVDSSLAIDFEVCAGETLVVYDNSTNLVISYDPSGSPSNYPLGQSEEYMLNDSTDPSNTPTYHVISNDRNYARGCILYTKYPLKNRLGDDILPADQECQIKFTNRLNEEFVIPLHQFFAHFVNPETRDANSLINKIEIINPNANFSVKVTGLIVYTKSNNDPSDCAC